MNIHKNARLTYVRRIEMVQDITLRGQTVGLWRKPQRLTALAT